MKVPVMAPAASLAATALLIVGLSVGCPSSTADPVDYGFLPIDPNGVTDSTAYTGATTLNPNGQPGVETVFTHRDGTRQITETILVLPDAAAATSALDGSKAALGETVTGATPGPAAVGTDGTIVAGTSPDGSNAVTVLLFTQGRTFATLEFEGAAKDPVPTELAVELGQAQDIAIKNGLPV